MVFFLSLGYYGADGDVVPTGSKNGASVHCLIPMRSIRIMSDVARRTRWLLVGPLLLLATVVPLAALPSAASQVSSAPEQAIPLNDRFGIAHISYGNGSFSPERYRLAAEAGVGWNRWAFYWNDVEPSPGAFNYTSQDATVAEDHAHGLKILGVLFGTPEWASENARVQGLPAPRLGQRSYPEPTRLQALRVNGASEASETTAPPRGLEQPVFADGTDTPGPEKTINPNNPWARFVFNTVQRYRGRVQAWEVWNEPDFIPRGSTGWFGFWSGDVQGYARLLKVAYLAAKAADPNATVVMGSMAYWFQNDFFPRLLAELKRDPEAAAHGYYFDATGWHWYSRASLLYERTLWVRESLQSSGIGEKPVWITETTLPVCGDVGIKEQVPCDPGAHRGDVNNQAAFILQALAYAQAAGVERVFVFQLFDDTLGPGEYFGLVRNSGVPRPAFKALQLATTYFRDLRQAYRTPYNGGKIELVTLLSQDGQRVRVVWNQQGALLSTGLPVEGTSPRVVSQDGPANPADTRQGALFSLALPAATLDDVPGPYVDYIVGGKPYLFIEGDVSGAPGRLEGQVQDTGGRLLGGVPLQVGERSLLTDSLGRYGVEMLPGLYDVAVSPKSAYSRLTAPEPATVVWTGKSTSTTFVLRGLRQTFLPLLFSRNSQSLR